MKYEVRREVECGCTIFSVYNTEINTRANYFTTPEEAQAFAERQEAATTRITEAIDELLESRLNIVYSWGLHNKRAIPFGVRFDVQGFKYTGEVKIILDYIPIVKDGKPIFIVNIGKRVYTGVTTEELIDFIDERVEKVDNYEEAVKASMTPEEYDFAQNVKQVIFF